MLFAEPQPTDYDIHFRVADVPTRVHPGFWLAAFLLGIGGEQFDFKRTLMWVAAMFGSILVHELGHALVIRRCGWRPHIVLYMLGGLAVYQPDEYPSWQAEPTDRTKARVGIALAGPAAGFLFGLAVVLLMLATGHGDFALACLRWSVGLPASPGGLSNARLEDLVFFLIQINLVWSLINLLPVLPLDGGQVAHELISQQHPYRGVEKSLRLSMTAALVTAVAALAWFQDRHGVFLAIVFGVLAYNSYRALQQVAGGGYDY